MLSSTPFAGDEVLASSIDASLREVQVPQLDSQALGNILVVSRKGRILLSLLCPNSPLFSSTRFDYRKEFLLGFGYPASGGDVEKYLAEVVGTMLLIILGDGVVANVSLKRSKAQDAGWIVVAVGWGLAVAMAVYAVGRISGAHINPAVTVSLATIGAFPWAEVPQYVLAQTIGGFLGAAVVWVTFLKHWRETPDPAAKLGVFSTIPAIRSPAANLVTEAIGTAVLLFGILALGDQAQMLKQPGDLDLTVVYSGAIYPLLVGLLVTAIGLSLGGPTGYAINPARDFGPRLAHAVLPIAAKGSSDWSYAWIPIVGPLLGGIAGALLYRWIGF